MDAAGHGEAHAHPGPREGQRGQRGSRARRRGGRRQRPPRDAQLRPGAAAREQPGPPDERTGRGRLLHELPACLCGAQGGRRQQFGGEIGAAGPGGAREAADAGGCEEAPRGECDAAVEHPHFPRSLLQVPRGHGRAVEHRRRSESQWLQPRLRPLPRLPVLFVRRDGRGGPRPLPGLQQVRRPGWQRDDGEYPGGGGAGRCRRASQHGF
mmetsp:Transcript_69371/g.206614  ORF Transcript_69371/g.206614 Transcript_69371/m.206614 type:complete len:210 (-) Transcript_69371:491-1120(-)